MIVLIHNDMELWDFMTEGLKSRDDFYDIPLNRYCSKLHRFLRKYFYKTRFPASFVLGKRLRTILKSLKPGDKVVVSAYTQPCIFHAIASIVGSEVGISLWLWNPIKNNSKVIRNLELLKNLGVKCSTFDSEDAKTLDLNFLNTFYNMNVKNFADGDFDIKYDFYFLGAAKDRGDIISDLEERLSAYKCLFIVPSLPSRYITYAENIKNIRSSKCIVEIVQHQQYDITLRPLEAIAYGCKLITNNIHIKEYPFYTSNNIFVWGIDNIEDLDDFLNSPYEVLDREIVEKYDINYWLDRV